MIDIVSSEHRLHLAWQAEGSLAECGNTALRFFAGAEWSFLSEVWLGIEQLYSKLHSSNLLERSVVSSMVTRYEPM